MSALVQLSGVSKVYRSLKGSDYTAVQDFSLDIERGEFFCLLGTSGCGKTTVLNMVAGFEAASAGSIGIAAATTMNYDVTRTPEAFRTLSATCSQYASNAHNHV